MYKIGIDLSTTNTGIVVLDSENRLIEKRTIQFRTFSESNYKYNFELIRTTCSELSCLCVIEGACVGIELSNFRNAQLTNRFSLYAGAFISNLISSTNIKEIKLFNCNQWQGYVGIKVGYDTREQTKMKSRLFAKEHCVDYKEDWSEDECDGYCIAYHLENVKSNEQKNIEVKQRKTKKYQKELRNRKLNAMIQSRLNKLVKLDPIRNKKLIKRLKQEIEYLKEQYNE